MPDSLNVRRLPDDALPDDVRFPDAGPIIFFVTSLLLIPVGAFCIILGLGLMSPPDSEVATGWVVLAMGAVVVAVSLSGDLRLLKRALRRRP